MSSSIKIICFTAIAVILIGLGAFLLLLPSNQQQGEKERESANIQHNETQANKRAPSTSKELAEVSLKLPFNTSDIDEQNGEVNPLGVVRFSKDQAEYGHSGIDIPLDQGSPIYAVADGPVVLVKSAGDPWGGQGIFQLLQPGSRDGEGLTFVYEHVTPVNGIKEGSKVKTGDLIGTKTPPAGFTAHFQMSHVFNNYEFTRGMECWVDSLNAASRNELITWWDRYSSSDTLINAWKSNVEEGQFPFLGLLDTKKFPNGPELCYPPGTDIR